MIKLTFIIITAAIAGIIWLRTIWARQKNRNASKKIVEDLKSGKHDIESYAESLDIFICSKSFQSDFDTAVTKKYLNSLAEKKLLEKYFILHGDFNGNKNGIVIAEVMAKDSVSLAGKEAEIDIFYPCWLYITVNEKDKQIVFRSTFPESKDHHHLLEDLAGEIYVQCLKN